MRYILFLFAIGSALLVHAQKKKAPSAYQLEAQRFAELITEAEQAEAQGELVTAEERYAQALLLKRDVQVIRKRSELLIQLGDTAGYCTQLEMVSTSDRGLHATNWSALCIRTDSVAFSAAGLSGTDFPGITNVNRIRHRSTGRITHKLYDANDSLRAIIYTSDRDTVYLMSEAMASFPGGERELYMFLGKNTRYPQYAMDAGLMGTIYITFVVDTSGDLQDIRVLRGVHHSLDNEAMRVVGTMPKWTPGMHQGRAVRSQYNLPIRFILK